MKTLGDFVSSPAVLYLILAVLALEALVLSRVARRRRRSAPGQPAPPLRGTLANLAAGACLILAMLATALAAPWGWIAACLTGAFVAHLVDLAERWHP